MSIMYITMCTVVTLLIYDQICISHRIRRGAEEACSERICLPSK